MKQKLKKSLKLKKRTIRKLDVRSGLRGGQKTDDTTATIVTGDCTGTYRGACQKTGLSCDVC